MNLVEHKKARLQYEIEDTLEAGIELLGAEVKSLRAHQGKLEGAHIIVRGGEAFVVGMSVPPYQPNNTAPGYAPDRARKLLLMRKELSRLAGVEGQKGLTIVPLAVYSKGRNIKISIGIARGRKKHDKRSILKARDAQREVERTLKNK